MPDDGLRPRSWDERESTKESETLPRRISKIEVVDGVVHVILAHERGIMIIGKGRCPDLKKVIDVGARHLVASEKEIGKLKCRSVLESGKVIVGELIPRRRWGPFAQKIALCIAM